MSRRPSRVWLLLAVSGILVGAAAATGHVVATSLTSDGQTISSTAIPPVSPADLGDAFREKLAPRRDGGPRARAVTARARFESGLLSPVRAAEQVAIVANPATRERAEDAQAALERAARKAFKDAADAAADGEPDSALDSIDDAVTLVDAAERAGEVATVRD